MYISVAEAAEKWGITPRQVQRLVADDRIPGSKKFGRSWQIPDDAEKPCDPRFEGEKAPQSTLAADLARVLATTYIPAPRDNPSALLELVGDERLRAVPEVGLAFWRGDFEFAMRRYREIDAAAVKLCASASAIASAICAGDYPFFLEVENFLKEVAQTNSNSSVSTFAELALAAAYTGATAPNMVADWLKSGDLSALPDVVKPDALYLRARYFQNLKQYDSMLAVAQTALCFCLSGHGITYMEVNLQLVCAVALSELGRGPEAEPYLLSAMRSCLPNGYMTGIAVNVTMAGGLIERLLKREYPKQAAAVLELANRAVPGWFQFHNRFTKENITDILPARDYQMARLVAQGKSYKKVAEQFDMSPGAVANQMLIVYEQLFISGKGHKKELAKYVL